MKSVARAKELNKLLVECNFPSICIHSAQKQDERSASCASILDWQDCALSCYGREAVHAVCPAFRRPGRHCMPFMRAAQHS